MPAIMTGTIVLWEEEADQKKGSKKKTDVARGMYKRTKCTDFENIGIYVPDENIEPSAVAPEIVAAYIKKKNDPKLWEAYGKGLLQIYEIERMVVVTPPRIPWDDE